MPDGTNIIKVLNGCHLAIFEQDQPQNCINSTCNNSPYIYKLWHQSLANVLRNCIYRQIDRQTDNRTKVITVPPAFADVNICLQKCKKIDADTYGSLAQFQPWDQLWQNWQETILHLSTTSLSTSFGHCNKTAILDRQHMLSVQPKRCYTGCLSQNSAVLYTCLHWWLDAKNCNQHVKHPVTNLHVSLQTQSSRCSQKTC